MQASNSRDATLIEYYCNLVRARVPTAYLTTFRIEHEERRVTSHHLIHMTKSAKGFRLMKDTMWGLGETIHGKGALALDQASLRGGSPLLSDPLDSTKTDILARLSDSPLQTGDFYGRIPEERDNNFCEKGYRKALKELEQEGTITITKLDGTPAPASTRRKIKGQTTMGAKYAVHLSA